MELNKDGQKDSVVQVKERNIQTRATLAQKGEDAQPKCSVTWTERGFPTCHILLCPLNSSGTDYFYLMNSCLWFCLYVIKQNGVGEVDIEEK